MECGLQRLHPHPAKLNCTAMLVVQVRQGCGVRDADRGQPHRRGAAHIGKFAETGEIALLGFHMRQKTQRHNQRMHGSPPSASVPPALCTRTNLIKFNPH